MFLFTERGQFIKDTGQYLINPQSVSIRSDGHMIVCDKSVKVLTPDGSGLKQSFNAPDCDTFPSHAVYHQDKFFVSYVMANCVKVFNKRGELQYDIGREGSGDVQLNRPVGLTIDRCNNLIVCDTGKSRVRVFSLDGTLVNSFSEGMGDPRFVAVTKDSKLLISDFRKHVISVFQ